jgi:phage tail P2-like protein
MNVQTLLPPNATDAERAIEATLARSGDMRVDLDKLWNPQTCPVALLPWLAWALSVDTWDSTWPEAIKRRVIAKAPAVHRAKGTRAAVAAALDGLMVKSSIIEWWQPGGSGVAGTFIIRAFAASRWVDGAALITPSLISAIRAMVTASAPVSRPWTLQVGVVVSAPIGGDIAVHAPLRIARPIAALGSAREVNVPLRSAAIAHRPLRVARFNMNLEAA